eukprot:5337192-Amphidinium_carterae.1
MAKLSSGAFDHKSQQEVKLQARRIDAAHGFRDWAFVLIGVWTSLRVRLAVQAWYRCDTAHGRRQCVCAKHQSHLAGGHIMPWITGWIWSHARLEPHCCWHNVFQTLIPDETQGANAQACEWKQ